MDISEPWFGYIMKREKRVEGRKNSKKWSHIKAGDLLMLTTNNDKENIIFVKVKRVTLYQSSDPLTEYLQQEGIRNCLPGVKTLKEARAIYLQWSTEEEIRETGFLGIEVKVV